MCLLLAQLPNSHLLGGESISFSKHAETSGPKERAHTSFHPFFISSGHFWGAKWRCMFLFYFDEEGGGEWTTFNDRSSCLFKIQPLGSLRAKLSVTQKATKNLNYLKASMNLFHYLKHKSLLGIQPLTSKLLNYSCPSQRAIPKYLQMIGFAHISTDLPKEPQFVIDLNCFHTEICNWKFISQSPFLELKSRAF